MRPCWTLATWHAGTGHGSPEDIVDNYEEFDAFVVLHGTDTMAYTASALAFMLENLTKTVVITGSQIPLVRPRNDGVANLLGSLTVAGHFDIPEVSLFSDPA